MYLVDLVVVLLLSCLSFWLNRMFILILCSLSLFPFSPGVFSSFSICFNSSLYTCSGINHGIETKVVMYYFEPFQRNERRKNRENIRKSYTHIKHIQTYTNIYPDIIIIRYSFNYEHFRHGSLLFPISASIRHHFIHILYCIIWGFSRLYMYFRFCSIFFRSFSTFCIRYYCTFVTFGDGRCWSSCQFHFTFNIGSFFHFK